MSVRHRFAGLLLLICVLAPAFAADPVPGKLAQYPSPEPPLGGPAAGSGSLPGGPPCCTTPARVAPAMALPCPADPPTPVVSIKVRTDACAAPHQEITYRIKVENRSAGLAHHVLVRNPLPANARFVRASPEPHQKEPEIQWKLNTMAPGACCDILLVLAPTNVEDVRNCVRVVFEHGQCVTTRQASAAPGAVPPHMPPIFEEKGGKEPPRVQPQPAAKLALQLEGPKKQFANLPAKYFLTVRNSGGSAAPNVLLRMPLPNQANYVSSTGRGSEHARQVAWLLGRLEPGASRSVEVALTAKAAGELCFKAFVSADEKEKEESADFCTIFEGQSALTMDTIDTKDPVEVGDQTSYLIRITNQGQVALTNLQLKAFLPPQMKLVRATGASDPPAKEPGPKEPLAFLPLKELAAGATAIYEVYVQALQAGDVRFLVTLTADQLDSRRPVIEQESTQLFASPVGN